MSYHEERAFSLLIDVCGWIVAVGALLGARFLWRRASSPTQSKEGFACLWLSLART